MTKINEQADWYRARLEREETWRGLLRKRKVRVGPATRVLKYVIRTPEGELPIYAGKEDELMERFVDYQVEVRGKLVDLREEGFGTEVWIASIRRVKN